MNHLRTEIHACGKLLITGEYLILRGARGLALPTSNGQLFSVYDSDAEGLQWTSLDHLTQPWLQCAFDRELNITSSSDKSLSLKLQSILREAMRMNPSFLSEAKGTEVITRLEFPRDWGLGSSSTLIYSLATWAHVDPLQLSERTLGGSGYDVAVAMNDSAILYQRSDQGLLHEKVSYNPIFKDHLFFVHLGKKKDSSIEVADFKSKLVSDRDINYISALTDKLVLANDLVEFNALITLHNEVMESILERPSAGSVFKSYSAGSAKYLGAWGGDFMLVTGTLSDMDYFRSLGMMTLLSYEQMIKKNEYAGDQV